MVAFTRQDEYDNCPDWSILRDGGVALYWRREILNEDIQWLLKQHYRVFSFECNRWTSSEEMHAEFQRTLTFPDYYGKNLDALYDTLSELAVPDEGGFAIVLLKFDKYASGPGAAAKPSGRAQSEIVLDVFARTSRSFLLTGRRFLTLVQTDDARIRFDDLSCVSATWNRREWLNKNRGL